MATIVEVCHNCHKVPQSLLKCSRCKSINYCSSDCQKANWAAHKTNCKVGFNDITNYVRSQVTMIFSNPHFNKINNALSYLWSLLAKTPGYIQCVIDDTGVRNFTARQNTKPLLNGKMRWVAGIAEDSIEGKHPTEFSYLVSNGDGGPSNCRIMAGADYDICKTHFDSHSIILEGVTLDTEIPFNVGKALFMVTLPSATIVY